MLVLGSGLSPLFIVDVAVPDGGMVDQMATKTPQSTATIMQKMHFRPSRQP